jgi:serine/threonine-protein kinase
LRAAFDELSELPPAQRAPRLDALREADAGLAAELAGLLRLHDAAAPAASPAAPQTVGAFTLLQELGRGGMGVVWLAEREHAGYRQRVALKLLHQGARSAIAERRFRREWQVLARLQHAHIAQIIDAGIDAEGRAWLAMELVDGPLLDEACARMPLAARVGLLADACDAVAYAHSQLVLHRDIKPANLRLGRDGRVRLLDFGIARLLDDSDPALTLTGVQACTPRYAAPEQLRGENVGTAADIHALGMLLREFCLADGADPLLQAVAARATEALPQDRYASAALMQDDLRDWLAGRDLRSGVGSRRVRLRRWAWQRRWPLGAAAGVLLTLAGGALATWQQARRAEAEAERARSHLSALLDVIGAASPEAYLGRDPKASEFLSEAARRLRALPDADPLLQWQAQAQIGQGLINLGRPQAAVPVLEAALAAAERLPGDGAVERRLDALRLLLIAHDDDGDGAALRGLAQRIEDAAMHPGAPAGAALTALAATAGVLARQGEFAAGRRLLDRASTWVDAAGVDATQRENYWRQRGWLALRERDLAEAQLALTAALALIDAEPAKFSPMRRAEGGWLLAERALQAGDGEAARRWLGAVEPQFREAFPLPHAERVTLALMQARAALLADDLAAAGARLVEAGRAGEGLELAPVERRHALAVAVHLAARSGDCQTAQARAEELAAAPEGVRLPNRTHIETEALQEFQSACR